MSAGSAAAARMAGQGEFAGRLAAWLKRYTPSQGWLTLALLLASVGVVAESVSSVEWVSTPGLAVILLLAVVSGLVLSKTPLHALLLHPVALLLGTVVVVFQAASLAEDPSLAGAVREMWDRMAAWYGEASTGGISADLMPISVIILGLTWVLGYVSSWFVFRNNTAWVAVVLGGLTIVSNLSFLPEEYGWKFFLYLFFAMLLVVRVNVVHRQNIWRRIGVAFSSRSGWQTLHAAVWVSIGVVLLSAFMPLRVVVSYELAAVWGAARQPVASMEDVFARLTSGIPCRKNFGCEFGENLPFTGKVSLGENVLFEANTDYPSYWLSHTYSEYTPSGWVSGDTEALEFGPDTPAPPQADLQKRVPVHQSIRTRIDTSEFLAGGAVEDMTHQATAQVLSPKRFVVDMQDSTDDALLPDDIRALANDLRQSLVPPPDVYLEAFISRRLPDDLVLIDVTPNDVSSTQFVQTVTVERKPASAPDIVSWRLTDGLREKQGYSMVSFVSVADDSDLTSASTDYSSFIEDHYLQLPAGTPQRVGDLARDLTQNLTTPFAKAIAIQSYLRGPSLAYSHDIDAPPRGWDGVDYFLFESKAGYSAYFASAMAVMLRTVDVPARMAVGYAPGEYDSELGATLVRDSDSHGWVQVYFPRYGWIDFEPTARFPVPSRLLNPVSEPGLETPELIDDPAAGEEDSELDPLELATGLEATDIPTDFDGLDGSRRLLVPALTAVGILALTGALIGVVWSGVLAGAASVEKLYSRLSRMGRLAGVKLRPSQTPIEYASAIESVLPEAGPDSRRIAWTFSSHRYGRKDPTHEDRQDANAAWKRIRGGMLSRAFGRLLGR